MLSKKKYQKKFYNNKRIWWYNYCFSSSYRYIKNKNQIYKFHKFSCLQQSYLIRFFFCEKRVLKKKFKWFLNPIFYNNSSEVLIKINLTTPILLYQKFWVTLWSTTVNKRLLKVLIKQRGTALKKQHVLKLVRYPQKRWYALMFLNFCRLYKTILNRNYTRFSHFLYYQNKKASICYNYRLYFTFTPNRFYINLSNAEGINYLSLSIGLLLKFFKHQKSLKKNKSLKFLLVKFLRKLIIVSKINNLIVFLKKTPTLVSEVFKFLINPLPSPFFDPISNQTILEEEKASYHININYIYFLKTISYTSMKQRQRGRLKRKIMKKVISKNRIVDEA